MEVLFRRSAEAARSRLEELPRLVLLPRSVVVLFRSSELVLRIVEGRTWEGIAVATDEVGETEVEREGEGGGWEMSLSFEGSRFLLDFKADFFGTGASRVEGGE